MKIRLQLMPNMVLAYQNGLLVRIGKLQSFCTQVVQVILLFGAYPTASSFVRFCKGAHFPAKLD